MERCVHKHVYKYMTANNLLTSYQSGFITGDSTVNQLPYIYNDICRALDDGKEVRAVFCDSSKAFDRVWHKGLVYTLEHIGIQGRLLSWLTSYLSSRKQRVVILFGPMLLLVCPKAQFWDLYVRFLIYINDINAPISDYFQTIQACTLL